MKHQMPIQADRDLLELAALAAGIQIDKSPYNGGGMGNTGFDVSGNAMLDWHNGISWNPLTDDGDALRLAMALGLVVDTSRPSAGEPFKRHHFAQEDFHDQAAATRRAIVRAAAAIGRDMP